MVVIPFCLGRCLQGITCLVVVLSALEMPNEGLGLWGYSREGCHTELCHLLGLCEPVEGRSGLVFEEILSPCPAQTFPGSSSKLPVLLSS